MKQNFQLQPVFRNMVLLGLLLFIWSNKLHAQNVGIGTNTPNASAILDITSNNKGLLIPRITQAQVNAISNPSTGLLIFQTDGTAGFYYNSGTPAAPSWTIIASGNNGGWGLSGNSGTNAANNFIGTTDEQSLIFKVNNFKAGLIDYSTCCSGTRNTAFGQIALNSITSGADNTATGYGSLYTNATGNQNAAHGKYALFNNNADNNSAFGFNAMFFNTTGANNTATGSLALQNNVGGSYNTANGSNALASNTTGNVNTANGYQSLYLNQTGGQNTATGYAALFSNLSGSYNTANGSAALNSNTGDWNTANGSYAMYSNTSGYNNTASGYQSLYYNTTGQGNTATGVSALYYNTTGNSNTANGYQALYSNTTGYFNIADGYWALKNNSTGYQNSANSTYALYYNTTGNYNTAVGYAALLNNTTGSNNTAVGYNANINPGSVLDNATAIGANAIVNQSNSMVLGSIAGYNSAATSTNIGIGVPAPQAPLHIRSANSDNFTNAKTILLEDAISTPTIRFSGTGNWSTRFWNITLEPITDPQTGIKVTNLVISNDHLYPVARFSSGSLNVSHLDVSDDADIHGNINLGGGIVQTSDMRLKQDIKPLQNVLPALLSLSGYTYYWKNNTVDSSQQTGVLAQEVQKVYPQLVKTNKNGTLGVNYIQLIPVLLTAIKEQQKIIIELQQAEEEQHKEIETLVKRFEQFEHRNK